MNYPMGESEKVQSHDNQNAQYAQEGEALTVALYHLFKTLLTL